MKCRRVLSALLALIIVLPVQPVLASSAPVLTGVDMTRNGLRGDYFLCDNLEYTAYVTTVVDANIDNTNILSTLLARCGRQEQVGVRWTGWVQCPGTGTKTVTVQTSTDDSCRVWINDTKVVDWWSVAWDSNSNTWGHNLATVELEGGQWYPFKMEYCQGTGGAFARIRWSTTGAGDNVSNQVIPAANFRLDTDFPDLPAITAVDYSSMASGIVGLTVSDFKPSTKLVVYSSTDTYKANPLDIVDNPVVVGGKIAYSPTALEPAKAYTVYAVENDVQVKGPKFLYFEGIPRPEYPTPAYARDYAWESLNGPWDFFNNRNNIADTTFATDGLPAANKSTIIVPYPWQSPYSGIEDTTHPGTAANRYAWYQRTITPSSAKYGDGKRISIRFGAVDANTDVYVNGTWVGYHTGGYTPFEYDITDLVTLDAENTVTVRVCDGGNWGSRDSFVALIGKQGTNAPVGYTATSGIWQSVILEGRYSATQLKFVHVNPLVNNDAPVVDAQKRDITHGVVPVDGSAKFMLNVIGGAGKTIDFVYNLESKIWDDALGAYVATAQSSVITGTKQIVIPAGENEYLVPDFTVSVPNQQLWHFDKPILYVGTVKLMDGTTVLDEVNMHFGQRDIRTAYWETSPDPTLPNQSTVKAYQYVLLNNKPFFMAGLLDQGFWEEGLYTAPTADALKFDISQMRANGFNTIRKHIKIEDPLEYMWADRLGMMFWQDMPEATQMNSSNSNPNPAGRVLYESSLTELINRDYNNPSKIGFCLFNETWGVSNSSANDGAWLISLYNKVKREDTSGRFCEIMSPCNRDNINPSDIHTFHYYPGGFSSAKNEFLGYLNNQYIGSTNNMGTWGTTRYQQTGVPFLNSEYGCVASGSGDADVSWCFKYMTEMQRANQIMQGYIYTEPHDVQYERNGFLKYDRSPKVFGYDEMAYGGDMSPAFLNGQEFVSIDGDPMVTLDLGGTYSSHFGAVRWSDNTKFQGPFKLKWRVDGSDQFGNKLSTIELADQGFRGEKEINYAPYTYEEVPFSFTIPNDIRYDNFAGSITVWIEDGAGKTIAKNFANYKVSPSSKSKAVDQLEGNSFILRQAAPVSNTNTGAVAGQKTGAVTYEYTVPENFDVDGLKSLRLYAELAPVQKLSTNGNVNHRPQTAVNYETPSDVVVSVNGIPVSANIFLPDGPNDIRGIYNLNSGAASSSASSSVYGGFGYLVNLDLDRDIVAQLKDQLKTDPTLTVVYEVKDTAAHKNGIRAYPDSNGRYGISPSVVLNAPELYYKAGAAVNGPLVFDEPLPSANYTVEAKVTGSTAAINAGYNLAISGNSIALTGNGVNKTVVSDTAIDKIRMTFADEQVKVYVNDNPQFVIDVYGAAAAATSVSVSGDLANVTVMPETFVKQPSISLSSSLQMGDRVVAKVENVGYEDTPLVLIAAGYDAQGRLANMVTDDSLISYKSKTLIKIFDPLPSEYTNLKFVVYAWSPDTFVPITTQSVTDMNPPPPALESVSFNGSTPANEGVNNLFDNNTSTKLYTGDALPLDIYMNFSQLVEINSFRIATGNDTASYTSRNPRTWTIAGSNDGVNYTVFYTMPDANSILPTTNRTEMTFNLDAPVVYQYYKLQITAIRSGSSGMQISEFNLRGPLTNGCW